MRTGRGQIVAGVCVLLSCVCASAEPTDRQSGEQPIRGEREGERGAFGEACKTERDEPGWLDLQDVERESAEPEETEVERAERLREVRREMQQIRAEHIRRGRGERSRQVAIEKIRGYTDPDVFGVLIDVFLGEHEQIDGGVLDHFADLESEEGDATLAWLAIFRKEREIREGAQQRLIGRVGSTPEGVGHRVEVAIAEGLRRKQNRYVERAAELARALNLYQAIPMLINAQLLPEREPGDGGERAGALADIIVGTQQAFVSDLTPVVGENAVAFDPTLSVVTSGTVVRVFDAYVVTYRVGVHNALVGLTTEGWGGRSTASLGYDQRAWRMWYANQFVPYRRQIREAGAQEAQGSVGG